MIKYKKIQTTPEKIEEAVEKLRGGDKSQINFLCNCHIGLVSKVASHFAKNYPHLDSEIYSYAMEVMVSKLNSIAEQEILRDNNLAAYLVSNVSYRLRRKVKQQYEESLDGHDMATNGDAQYNCLVNELLNSKLLTPKEREFLALLIEGWSTAEIVEKMNVSRQRVAIVKRALATKLKEFL